VTCRICDQHKSVGDRCTEWEEPQEQAKVQAQAERRRMVEFSEASGSGDFAQWCPVDGLAGPDCVAVLSRNRESESVGTRGQQTAQHVTLDEIRCSSARRLRKPRLAVQQTRQALRGESASL
jgi:hypothetical protein